MGCPPRDDAPLSHGTAPAPWAALVSPRVFSPGPGSAFPAVAREKCFGKELLVSARAEMMRRNKPTHVLQEPAGRI